MYNFLEIISTVRSQERPIRFLVATALQKTGICRHFKVKHKDFMLLFDQSGLSKAMWVDPNCRCEDISILYILLRDGDTFLDVGANIGTLALTASGIVGSAGKVYAIEPHPRTFLSLKRNIALNKRNNITSINVALGADSGTILFSDRADDSQNAVIDSSELQSQFLEVPVRRMDDLPLGKAPITLLKIDVEGYEKLVLEGGKETLARTSCIYLEAYDRFFARYGYTCAQVWELLRDHGFQVYRFQGARYLAPVPLDFESIRCENYIAIKDHQEISKRTIGGILDFLASGPKCGD